MLYKNTNDLKINVNNNEISYDDLGEGNVPLIFIHGFPFDKSSWKFQISELKQYFRVIAYDCRGFGKSSSDNKPFSIEIFADDLIGLMDGLNINKAIICGLSMGGYVALNAISRYPERFEKLILCDTQCNGDSAEGKDKRYKAIEFLNNGGVIKYADTFIKNLFTERTIIENPVLINLIKSIIVSTPKQSLVSTLSALAERPDSCKILSLIKAPTLILCGREDVITPLVKSEYLLNNISSATLKIIDSAGHLSSMEQPEIFNNYLYEFINGSLTKNYTNHT